MDLAGLIGEEEVDRVQDDTWELRASGRAVHEQLLVIQASARAAARWWVQLPTVLDADRVTPVLLRLIHPVVGLADAWAGFGEEFRDVCAFAAGRLEDFTEDQQRLVARIRMLHADARSYASRAAFWEGAGVVSSWREVPELVERDQTLRVMTGRHNEELQETLHALARRFYALQAPAAELPPVRGVGAARGFLAEGVPVQVTAALVGGISLEMLAGLPAEGLLGWLASHSAEEIGAAIAADPGLVQRFWDRPPNPAAVARWWNSLSEAEKTAWVTGPAAAVIGNLGGIAYTWRDRANRSVLTAALTEANERVKWLQKLWENTPCPGAEWREIGERLRAAEREAAVLKDIDKALKADKNHHVQRYLIDLNLGVQPPLAAVAIGNLDTARNVAYAVPGMGTLLDGEHNTMTGWANAAQNVYDQRRNTFVSGADDFAVIAWIGYHAPTQAGEPSVGAANAGAPRLAHELDALHDTRKVAGNPVSVGVLAHSYGSTLVSNALTVTHQQIDRVVIVGSAGLATQPDTWNVARIDGQPQVFATHAPGDKLATIGYNTSAGHGINPGDPARPQSPGTTAPQETVRGGFAANGVTIYESDGDADRKLKKTDGHEVLGTRSGEYFPGGGLAGMKAATPGHGYLDRRTESLYNTVQALTGQPENMTGKLVVQPPKASQ